MLSDWSVARAAAIACAVIALFLAAWAISDVLLLAFAAILVAIGLHGLAGAVTRYTGCPPRAALAVVCLLVAGLLGVVAYLFGNIISAQVRELFHRLPAAWETFQDEFHLRGMVDDLMRRAEAAATPSGATVLSAVRGVTSNIANVLVGIFLIVVGGLYFAMQPHFYRRLLISLFPPQHQDAAGRRVDGIGQSLRCFLQAQLIAMIVVGLLCGIGLAVLGVPAALALGLFAGLAEFVPMVGPVMAAIPALLLALTVGMETTFYTLLLFLVVQQVESNIISPLLQQELVSLPAAVTLFSVVAFGTLLGPLGLLLATPLTVLVFALCRPDDNCAI
ncbi:AI-2E family transporter [Azorhizobium caulinodans]|nr:AI-2E family transporter [Azorhizobium caulinodans]